MKVTDWRPLTKQDLDRGVILYHWSERPRTRVRCVTDTHDYDVPLLHQPDRPGVWEGVCGYCQRPYRLTLEVGSEVSRGAQEGR